MENNMGVLLLRPHHIETLKDLFEIVKQYGAWRFGREDVKQNNFIKRGYGPDGLYSLDTLEIMLDIADQLMQNPQTLLRFTTKPEDPLCNSCIHRKGCLDGDFTDYKTRLWKNFGLLLSGNNPPVEADQRAILKYSIDLNKVYRASDFFSPGTFDQRFRLSNPELVVLGK